MSRAERVRDRLHYTFQQDGMSARTFLDTFAVVIEERLWETLSGIDSFREFCDAPFPPGLGVGADRIVTLVETLRHPQEDVAQIDGRMAWLRTEVGRLIRDEVVPAGAHGSNQHRGVGNTKSSSRGANDATYVMARLKRDDPQLAQRVVEGHLSPNAAAVQAGIRPQRISVCIDDMEKAAAALRRRLSDDQRRALAKLLT
jgi:hypothetical protein